MTLLFTGEIWYRRGPWPFHFVTVPAPEAAELLGGGPGADVEDWSG